MRPNDLKQGKEVYECFGCGNRVEEPDMKVCNLCGSDMRNIGRPRDL